MLLIERCKIESIARSHHVTYTIQVFISKAAKGKIESLRTLAMHGRKRTFKDILCNTSLQDTN